MDLELAKFLFQVLTFLMTGCIGIYVYLSNKDKVTNDRIGKLEDDLDAKLDGQTERIAKLETQVGGAPTHDHIGDLYEKVHAVDTKVSSQGGKLESIDATLRMILSRITEKGMQ